MTSSKPPIAEQLCKHTPTASAVRPKPSPELQARIASLVSLYAPFAPVREELRFMMAR